MRALFPLVSFVILSVVPACVCSRDETITTQAPAPSTPASTPLVGRPPLAASLRPAFNGRMPLFVPDGGVRPIIAPGLRPFATASAAP
jgi:hypothetical protein